MSNRIAKIISCLLSAVMIFSLSATGKTPLISAAAKDLDNEALESLWKEYLDGLPPAADIIPLPFNAALLLEDGTVQLCGLADDGSDYYSFDTCEWKNMTKLDCVLSEDVPLLAGLTDGGAVSVTGHIPQAWCDTGSWTDISTIFCGDTGAYLGGSFVIGITADGSLFTAGSAKMQLDRLAYTEAGAEWRDLKAISCANHQIFGLRQDGTVLNSGSHVGYPHLDNWSDLTDLTVCDVYTAGLRTDGRVLFEFGNYYVYDGRRRSAEEWQTVSEWENMISLAGCSDHLLGLRADGRVLGAGLNDCGQCDVADWDSVTALAVGKRHSAALLEDGTVVAAGDNSCGQCDVAGWTDVVQIAAMDYATVGLQRDGSVISTETKAYQSPDSYNEIPVQPLDLSALEEIISIGTGADFIAGLRKDGTVTVIGRGCNIWNELAEWNNMQDIAVGYSTGQLLPDDDLEGHFLAGLQEDGTVRLLCSSSKRHSSVVLDWQDIVAVEAGGIAGVSGAFLIGLQADGTVKTIGAECHVDDWKHVVSIEASDSAAFGICEDGTVQTYGDPIWSDPFTLEKIGSWTDISQISFFGGHGGAAGLKTDGTVILADCSDEEREAEGWQEIEKIVKGNGYLCGIDRHGRLRYAGIPCFGAYLYPDWFEIEGLLSDALSEC